MNAPARSRDRQDAAGNATPSTWTVCPYCEQQPRPGCEECSGTGRRYRTVIDGTVVHGDAPMNTRSRAAVSALIEAAGRHLDEQAAQR